MPQYYVAHPPLGMQLVPLAPGMQTPLSSAPTMPNSPMPGSPVSGGPPPHANMMMAPHPGHHPMPNGAPMGPQQMAMAQQQQMAMAQQQQMAMAGQMGQMKPVMYFSDGSYAAAPQMVHMGQPSPGMAPTAYSQPMQLVPVPVPMS